MADRKCCDICGSVIEGRPVIRSDKTNYEFSVYVKGYLEGNMKSYDICQECFKKIEWHKYDFDTGHKYEPALGAFFK